MQRGERELKDQLTGLGPALAEAKGKRILDLGCAEGLIALAFLDRGAKGADCVESNPQFVPEARRQLKSRPAIVHRWDLNNGIPGVGPCDIALLLAILHKLKKPLVLLGQVLERTHPALVVIRYPRNCDGIIVDGRSDYQPQDVPGFMAARGYRCERKEMGPKRELTAYFRKG